MGYLVNLKTLQRFKVRVLLDSGANASLINAKVARQAQLHGEKTMLVMNVAGNSTLRSRQMVVEFGLISIDQSYVSPPITATTIESIGEPFQPIPTNVSNVAHLKDIKFTEDYPIWTHRPLDVLIAEPHYSQLMMQDQRVSPDLSLPSAKLTKLGWMLRGAIPAEPKPVNIFFYEGKDDHMTFDLSRIYSKSMEEFDFKQFWSGENVGISPNEPDIPEGTSSEIDAIAHQRRTAKYDKEKQFWSVELPWVDPTQKGRQLSNNLQRAIAMWHQVTKRIHPDHVDMVVEAYEEFHTNGYSELVPEEKINRRDHPTYVMTSHPVIRLNKTTTKCRIVTNASLPDQGNKSRSLNKLLLAGPNMLPQITEMILHAKTKPFIATIDVQKMFLSVRLSKESDQDMLRYVWAPPGQSQPRVYRFTRLPFGCVCSPFLAIWCLRQTAAMWKTVYPNAAQIILDKTYMDDILILADSVDEIRTLITQVLIILKSGGFYGHKISTNDLSVLNGIDEKITNRSRIISLLGLRLDFDVDHFKFDLDDKFKQFDKNAQVITRRNVVSLASQVFDTQGYVAPYVMRYKQILPLLWHNKNEWDENLLAKVTSDPIAGKCPDPIALKAVELFSQWIEQIPMLKELSFPRWAGGPIAFIAIFSDASSVGMGVAAYLISNIGYQKLNSQLVFAKSCLMPKNLRKGAEAKDALTIARAELIGLVMAVNMGCYLKNAYKNCVEPDQFMYFTDSLLNLQRVQRGKGQCKVWEERRKQKILMNTPASNVNFCPGKLNPADLPSRGCSLEELQTKAALWGQGPDFLTKRREYWPTQPVMSSKMKPKMVESEQAQSDVQIYCMQIKALNEIERAEKKKRSKDKKEKKDLAFIGTLLTNCGSWRKAVNVLVRIKRMFQRRSGHQDGQPSCHYEEKYVTMKEWEWAEIILARHAQCEFLSEETNIIRTQGKISRKDFPKISPIKDLPVFWDDNYEVLRLKTRLHLASSLTHDFKNPIILPKGPAAEKRILHTHMSRLHASQRQTFNIMRQKFWVLGGFKFIKQVVRRCRKPRCRYIKFESPKMSPLPAIRIDNPQTWAYVSLDYMGPLACKHECYPEIAALIKKDNHGIQLRKENQKSRKKRNRKEMCAPKNVQSVDSAFYLSSHKICSC